MKHTTEELLLALGVRDLAARRRLNLAPEHASETEKDEWLAAHPIGPYVIDVIGELEMIAGLIAGARQAPSAD